jgi:hypothetical protein
MLDALVTEASAALGIPATRDPSVVPGLVAQGSGCLFIGFPVHVSRLMAGPNIDVPISLVAPAPSDLLAVNWLLDNIDALVDFAHASTSTNGPVTIGDLNYPAVTVTARIAL